MEDGREPSTFSRLVAEQQASYTDIYEITAPTSPIALAVSSQHTRSQTSQIIKETKTLAAIVKRQGIPST